MDLLFDPTQSAGTSPALLASTSGQPPTYDPRTQSFGRADTSLNYPDGEDGNEGRTVGEKRQVRQVADMRIMSRPPPSFATNVATATGTSNSSDETHALAAATQHYDSFTGLIDTITEQPLHGKRTYAITGEIYEGPFDGREGLRHGHDAVVQNVWLPEDIPVGVGILNRSANASNKERICPNSNAKDMPSQELVPSATNSNSVAKFFGTYQDDQPYHGTLIKNETIYHGPLWNYRPHTTPPTRRPRGALPYNAMSPTSWASPSPSMASTPGSNYSGMGRKTIANTAGRYGGGIDGEEVVQKLASEKQSRSNERKEADRTVGTLARRDGFRYEGEFRYGHFDGRGIEVGPITTFALGNDCETSESIGPRNSQSGRGVYRGEYVSGLRHGIGSFAFYIDADSALRSASRRQLMTVEDGDVDDYDDYARAHYDTAAKNEEERCMVKANGAGSEMQVGDSSQENDFDTTLTASQLAASIDAALLSDDSDASFDFDDAESVSCSDICQPVLEREVAQAAAVSGEDCAAPSVRFQRSQSMKRPRKKKRVLYSYSGHWNAGRKDGEGTERMPSGAMYQGNFRKDQREGFGTISYWTMTKMPVNIRSAAGIWCNGKPVDDVGWTISYTDGSRFTGFTKIIDDGMFQPHGYGVKMFGSGDVYCGCWREDKRCGEGIFISKGVTEIVGNWEDDELTDNTSAGMVDFLESAKSLSEKGAAGMDLIDVAGKRVPELGVKGNMFALELQKAMLKEYMSMCNALAKNNTSDESETYEPAQAPLLLALEGGDQSDCATPTSLSDEFEEVSDVPVLQSYASGDAYLGCVSNEGQWQGYGIYYESSSGGLFSGNFRADRREGFGALKLPKTGTYYGNFIADQREGDGTLFSSDGSTYYGEFLKGVFHGKGTLTQKDGRTYVGYWKEGKENGEGSELLSNGQIFHGEFKDGLRDGSEGTLLESVGGPEIYRGSWKVGLWDGEGKLLQRLFADPADMAAGGTNQSMPNANQNFNKSVVYEGEFAEGQLHGYGKLMNEADGSSYSGRWDKNIPLEGKWRIEYHDGSIYSGYAKPFAVNSNADSSIASPFATSDGIHITLLNIHQSAGSLKPDGFGTLKYASGDLYIGNFVDGLRQGSGGRCVFANGDEFEGDWIDDRPDLDDGVLTLSDGKTKPFSATTPNKNREDSTKLN